MLFKIRVVPGASRNLVKETGGDLKVYLTKPAQDGLANTQLIGLLSGHFKVKKYQVRIIRGERSRDKIVEVAD